MATLILRPNSDSSLGHSAYSGSSGYAMINEATVDNDTTYIYQSVSSTSTTTASSIFTYGGFDINKIETITKATFYVVGKISANYASSAIISATIGSVAMPAKDLTTAYQTFSADLSDLIDEWNSSVSDNIVPNVSATITTTGAATSGRKDANTFQNRITQSYIEIEYEPRAQMIYTINLQQPVEGNAAISKNSGLLGDTVTATISDISSNYDFVGWYSDTNYETLLSSDPTYTFSISGDLTLYPLVKRPTCTVTISTAVTERAKSSGITRIDGFSADYSDLTPADINNIQSKNFSLIKSSKKYDTNYGSSLLGAKEISFSLNCPKGACVIFYATHNILTTITDSNFAIAHNPWTPGQDMVDTLDVGHDYYISDAISENTNLYIGMADSCDITLYKGTGIQDCFTPYNPSIEGGLQEFTCTVKDHFTFDGWYEDINYTKKISSNMTDSWHLPHGNSTVLSKRESATYYTRAIPDPDYWTKLFWNNLVDNVYQPVRQVYQKTADNTWKAVDPKTPFEQYSNRDNTPYLYKSIDDEIFGDIIVNTTTLDMDENSSQTIQVKLNRKPTNTQTVSIISGTGITVSPTSLSFQPKDWYKEQDIILTSTVNDNPVEITLITRDNSTVITVDLRPGAPDPDDPAVTYGKITATPIISTINENETATISVALTSAPTASRQIVSATPADSSLLAVSPKSLIFTPENWNIAQTLTVTALPDNDSDNAVSAILLATNGNIQATLNLNILDSDTNELGPEEPVLPITVYNNRVIDDQYANCIQEKWRKIPVITRQYLIQQGANAIIVDPAQDNRVYVKGANSYEDFSGNTAAFTYDNTSYYPTSMSSLESSAVHEIGHILLNRLADKQGTFYRGYNNTFKSAMASEGPNAPFDLDIGYDAMYKYHTTNQKEYFAETFEYLVEKRVPVARWLEKAPKTYQFVQDTIDMKYS